MADIRPQKVRFIYADNTRMASDKTNAALAELAEADAEVISVAHQTTGYGEAEWSLTVMIVYRDKAIPAKATAKDF